jgi:NAD+ diphosphatase
VRPGNTFASAVLDRAGTLRTDPGWLERQLADPAARALVASTEGPFVDCTTDPPRPARLPLAAFGDALEPVLLGITAEGPLFAVDIEGRADVPELGGARSAVSLRDAGTTVSREDATVLAYATAILNWHRNHRFCSRCGSPTEMAEAGHVRRCPECGALHHPRTDPVVIMLVHDRDRVLLGRQSRWRAGRWSTFAGFVEPGESLEEAVAREVEEEAGVEVADLRYHGSQPWPFPASLMVGFHARYAGGEPVVRDGELEGVRWFGRDELASMARGESDLHLPPRVAISRQLIDTWLEG